MSTQEQERDARELRQKLERLEARVEELNRTGRRGRSFLGNALLAFVIVFLVTLVGIGIIQYVSLP